MSSPTRVRARFLAEAAKTLYFSGVVGCKERTLSRWFFVGEAVPFTQNRYFSTAWGVCTLLMCTSLSGCSSVIDVAPDCDTRSDCGAYVCNTANTACTSSCTENAECAPAFVCLANRGECEGGYCSARDDGASLPIDGLGWNHYVFAPPLSASGDGVGLVLAANAQGIGFRRLESRSFLWLEAPLDAPLEQNVTMVGAPVVVAAEDAQRWWMTWASKGGTVTSLKTAYFSPADGARGNAQTLYAFPENRGPSGLRALVAGEERYFTWYGGTDVGTPVQALRVRASGAVEGPFRVSQSGRLPALTAFEGAVRIAWIDASAGAWEMRARRADTDGRFDDAQSAPVIRAGVGVAPFGMQMAATREGAVFFLEQRTGDGRIARSLVRWNEETGVISERNWLSDYTDVERVDAVQHPNGGALGLVHGRWRGELGLWMLRVENDASVDAIPVRVLDHPLTARTPIVQMALRVQGPNVWATWSHAQRGGEWQDLNLRGFRCIE